MRVKRSQLIVIRRAPGNARQARVQLAHAVVAAAVGRGGILGLKREGDGGTPRGRFPLRMALYRADRMQRPRTVLPLRAIRDGDGWSDDPRDANYNRLITLPCARSAEGLKRKDHVYDLIAVLGYNDGPRVKGRGSAIFMHLARAGYSPTEGCIALSQRDLTRLLAQMRPGTRVVVLG